MASVTSLRYIDIFAGCGGMSLGLYEAGLKGIFAIEKNQSAFETLSYNLISKKSHFEWPDWLPQKEHDINEVIQSYPEELRKLRGRVDLVVGGPPCQGFSFAGRRNRNDLRNKGVYSYIRFIELVKPRALFFENVKGFTVGFKSHKKRGRPYSSKIIGKLEDLGYNVASDIVNFSDYGIPQNRKRFILVGLLEGDPEEFFKKIKAEKNDFIEKLGIEKSPNVGHAISDLLKDNGVIASPDSYNFTAGTYSKPKSKYQTIMREGCNNELPDSHRFARHNEKIVSKFTRIMKECDKGRAITPDLRKKLGLNKKSITPLSKQKKSPTLTTLPDDYIHYSEPRILTVREYARIQSFKDWFEFKGKYTTGGPLRKYDVPRYTQIGNAIPPLFGQQSGNVFNEMLK